MTARCITCKLNKTHYDNIQKRVNSLNIAAWNLHSLRILRSRYRIRDCYSAHSPTLANDPETMVYIFSCEILLVCRVYMGCVYVANVCVSSYRHL